MQPNLLFDYKRETGDMKRAAPPESRQRVASLRSVSMCSITVRPLFDRPATHDAWRDPRGRRTAIEIETYPRAGKRRISIALCHAVSATATQIGPYVASFATLSVSPSSSSDTATSSTGST